VLRESGDVRDVRFDGSRRPIPDAQIVHKPLT
jgi:hypothetical protein